MGYHILVFRDTFTPTTTSGKLFINGKYFCFTLEDRMQPHGIKVYGETCIPEGTYYVDVTMSARFKRLMPIFFNQTNGYELIKDNNSWKGLRLHGGNKHTDSDACVLVARTRITPELIQGSMESELTKELIKLGSKGYITIVNNI